MSTEKHFSALRASALFQNLSDDDIVTILPKFEEKHIPAGTIIFSDGSSNTDGMYVIGKGSVKIYKTVNDSSAKQQAIAVLTGGSYFGDMALLDEETRSAGAMALEDCELLYLSKQAFHEMINQNLVMAHQILTQIAKVMSKRLRDTNNLFREVVGWGYRARKEVRDLKNNFLSTISHELRTPIHSIQGFTALMKDSQGTDEQTKQKFVDIILNESKRLGGLINDLICLAEIEFGAIVLDRHPVNLAEIMDQSYRHFQDEAAEKNLKYELSLQDNLPGIVADVTRLSQAIEHLIDNGIKFTPYGKSVLVKAENTPNEIIISVIDSGKGIPALYKDRIFDKFYQVDQSNTREIGGAGIGLTLARQIIHLHGGTISVDSKEGEGSTFMIKLPKEHIIYKGSS